MRFLGTIVLLVAVVCVIGVPYFIGHGLAVHSSGWIVAGVVSGVVAGVLVFLALKAFPREDRASH